MSAQPVITLLECCDLLARLDGRSRPFSYWSIRRALHELSLTDPLIPTRHSRGAAMLTPVDVALCRLWERLAAEGLRRDLSASIVANNRDALLDAFRRQCGRVLVVRGVRGDVASAREAGSMPGLRVDLDACMAGVVPAMRAVRAERPQVWNGWRYEAPRDVEAVPSSRVALSA